MMKTTLPKKITTLEEAKAFLTNLFNNDESYDPMEDAHDINWTTCKPTDEEKDQLNELISDIYDLPPQDNGKSFDAAEFWWDMVLEANPMLNKLKVEPTLELPDRINSVEEAKKFLEYLMEIENAPECIQSNYHDSDWRGVEATKEEKKQLNKLMGDIYKFRQEFDLGQFLYESEMKDLKRLAGWDEGEEEGPGWRH